MRRRRIGGMVAGSTALALALSVLAACAGGPLPPTHYYTLGAPSVSPGNGGAQVGVEGLVVGVESFSVDPPYDQDRLVYRKGEDSSQVGFYNDHRWASPLDRLLAVAVADALRGTPGIASIEPANANRGYTARLGGRLLYVEEVDSPEGAKIRMAVEMKLTSRAGDTLWRDTLTNSIPGPMNSPQQAFAAVDRAFAAIVAQARSRLAESLGSNGLGS